MADKPKWTAKVPEPEVSVDYEDGKYRAELVNYVEKGGRVKDIRVRGPARNSKKEARKDCAELLKAAFKGGYDTSLFEVRAKRKELETVKWKEKDLVGPDVEDKAEEERERRHEEKRKKEQLEQDKKELEAHPNGDTLVDIVKRMRDSVEKYRPVGPKWIRPGSLVSLPRAPAAQMDSWMIHEKQDAAGKHRPWLYFNAATGKYYQQKPSGDGYIQIGEPHDPKELPLNARIGSASLPSRAGKKLDMAVQLPELHKTGFLLKQSLEFLDKPASLVVLCDGLRGSAAASEFCARKFHSILLPKLSARASEWEDFELVDIVRDAAEALDGLLQQSPACFSGCSLAVALQAGTRLVLGALGGVRCIVCKPSASRAAVGRSLAAARAAAAATQPWSSRLVVGGDVHTVANEEERLRVESAGNRLLEVCASLCSCSAPASVLDEISDERERILVLVSRATSPFACLSLKPEDLKDGTNAVRKIYRKRSLMVHPDKVGEGYRSRAVPVFSKLQSAADAVETMLQTDQSATILLAEIAAAHDGGKLSSDPAVAAKLLGVQEGTAAGKVKEAVKRKFHGPLSRLQHVCRKEVEQAFLTLEVAEEAVARGTCLWTPTGADEGVQVTRALGCKDLKAPVPLLAAGMVAECIELEPGTCVGVALLADGANSVAEFEVARQLARHAPSASAPPRPRAAALRLALQGAEQARLSAVGAVCAYFDFDGVPSTSSGLPPAKRARTAKPARVRISHVLLRWIGLKGDDSFGRPGFEVTPRTQGEAEQALLVLLEELIAGDPKTLGTRFKAEVLKRSECYSALNVPYADLGWIDQGGAELSLEAAAFDTPIGGLSDVVTSSRGAHLMYRMA